MTVATVAMTALVRSVVALDLVVDPNVVASTRMGICWQVIVTIKPTVRLTTAWMQRGFVVI